ncbi:MAG: hypothetical protein ACI9UN_004733, partial [Granulosicoccus sp.]
RCPMALESCHRIPMIVQDHWCLSRRETKYLDHYQTYIILASAALGADISSCVFTQYSVSFTTEFLPLYKYPNEDNTENEKKPSNYSAKSIKMPFYNFSFNHRQSF